MVDYCSLEQIKFRLNIKVTETETDDELKDIRSAIQAYIDKALKKVGISVPLAATNNSIAHICAELCAGEYRRRRATPDEENSQWKTGIEALDAYIDAEGESEIPFIVGEATS